MCLFIQLNFNTCKMSWLEQLEETEMRAWQSVMNRHSFDFNEWSEARERLSGILKSNNLKANEQSVISYIDCCAESVGNVHPLPILANLVEEFYHDYGMESAEYI